MDGGNALHEKTFLTRREVLNENQFQCQMKADVFVFKLRCTFLTMTSIKHQSKLPRESCSFYHLKSSG